jgi:hypothetical protein
MKRNFVLILIVFTFLSGYSLIGADPYKTENIISNLTDQDTIKEKQILYNGKLWENRYHRILGDQFLFSNLFLSGTVSINGRTFKNLRLKYDIYLDEIIIPVNNVEILQVNKEMVDSFTISFENKVYRFTNIREDTLKGPNGYVNVLYKGKSALYVRYKKEISPYSTPTSDGSFIENHLIYFEKDSISNPITNTNSLIRVIMEDKEQITNFIKTNKLKISNKLPESFVPVIRYYDSISK